MERKEMLENDITGCESQKERLVMELEEMQEKLDRKVYEDPLLKMVSSLYP